MPENVPPEFYDTVDRFINLANELTRTHEVSRVSAVIMYAAARYNAHCMKSLDPNVADHKDDAVGYFVEQYRAMLEENVHALLQEKSE